MRPESPAATAAVPGQPAHVGGGWVHTMFDALAGFVQVANWRAHGSRWGDFTLHKSLTVDQAPSAHAGTRAVNDLLAAQLALPPHPRVLDAGCGFGGTVFHLHERLGGTYDGCTLSRVQRSAATREARRRGIEGACRFHLRDFDAPIAGPYDAIVAIESLSHAPDLAHTLRGFAAALRPGGTLALVEDTVAADIDALHPEEAQVLRRHWGCARFPREEDYAALLPAAGLAVVRRIDLTPRVRHRPPEVLDRLARRYRAWFRAIPLPAVRGVVSAFLGGVALEMLYARGEARYGLLVARKPGASPDRTAAGPAGVSAAGHL